MIRQSVLPEILQDFDYYKHKLPMYLQQSDGFLSHFRIWYDFLVSDKKIVLNDIDYPYTSIVGSADTLFNLLNIFDIAVDDYGGIVDNYLNYINALAEVDESDEYTCDILDKLAALFGLTRSFQVSYGLPKIYKRVKLTNSELLLLIRTQIIRNYCDGSYEQIRAYYETVGLRVLMYYDGSAQLTNYLLSISNAQYTYTDNVQYLFLAGLLTIQSMGIAYSYAIYDETKALFWATADTYIEDALGWEDEDNQTGGEWII